MKFYQTSSIHHGNLMKNILRVKNSNSNSQKLTSTNYFAVCEVLVIVGRYYSIKFIPTEAFPS